MAIVIVRTVCLLFEVVSLAILHRLAAAQPWTGDTDVLLGADRVGRGGVVHCLRALALSVQ